ncbi:MAG: hypothetical protein GY854_13640 [Deltaproteobacteria bacterium]|nr:hypothetical protein [Deltaproteobacteria bacterium]
MPKPSEYLIILSQNNKTALQDAYHVVINSKHPRPSCQNVMLLLDEFSIAVDPVATLIQDARLWILRIPRRWRSR